jgi:hypothetical protein
MAATTAAATATTATQREYDKRYYIKESITESTMRVECSGSVRSIEASQQATRIRCGEKGAYRELQVNH